MLEKTWQTCYCVGLQWSCNMNKKNEIEKQIDQTLKLLHEEQSLNSEMRSLSVSKLKKERKIQT